MQITALPIEEIKALLGMDSFKAWDDLCTFLSDHYSMDIIWGTGGKYGAYECKYRKSGKTLCTFLLKEKCFDILLIYGKDERAKFEAQKQAFTEEIQDYYDKAHTYHDGKWMFMTLRDNHLNSEFEKMICIKKKPLKKSNRLV